jgi:hypothetical protein
VDQFDAAEAEQTGELARNECARSGDASRQCNCRDNAQGRSARERGGNPGNSIEAEPNGNKYRYAGKRKGC